MRLRDLGRSLQEMLGMVNGVFIIFSLIFLFYTNSFLIRRRKREFGLYNILGMGKGNIGRILFWESVYTTLISLVFACFSALHFQSSRSLVLSI